MILTLVDLFVNSDGRDMGIAIKNLVKIGDHIAACIFFRVPDAEDNSPQKFIRKFLPGTPYTEDVMIKIQVLSTKHQRCNIIETLLFDLGHAHGNGTKQSNAVPIRGGSCNAYDQNRTALYLATNFA